MRRLRVYSLSLSLVTFGCVGAPYEGGSLLRASVPRKDETRACTRWWGCETNKGEPSRTELGQYFPKFFPNLGTADLGAGDLGFRSWYLSRVQQRTFDPPALPPHGCS